MRFLRGKKTYIVSILALAFAAYRYLEGDASLDHLVDVLQVSLTGSTIRSGIAQTLGKNG